MYSIGERICLVLLFSSLTFLTREDSVPTSLPSVSISSSYPTSSTPSSSIPPASSAATTTPTQATPLVRQYSCVCDVRLGVCDANCCCDVDCSEAVITDVFTCDISDGTASSQSCVQTDYVYIFNSVGTFVDGILCVERNNNPSATLYTPPQVVTDSASFQRAVDSHGSGFAYPQPYVPISQPVFYRVGDPICALLTDNTTTFPSLLSLPQGVNSDTCSAYAPVAFYTSFSSSCYQPFDSLQSGCVRGSALDSTRYTSSRIFKLPKCYGSSVTDSAGLTLELNSSCVDANDTPVNCPLSLSPVYNQSDDSCYPALSSLHLSIETNGTDGISSITARLRLTRLRRSPLPLKQSYSVVFSSVTDNQYQEALSGNPGYLDTYPVVVASPISPTTPNVTLLPQSLTILQSNPTCNTSQRTVVGFRDNLASGCVYSVDLAGIQSRCLQLQAETRSLLLGNGYHTHIAVFGNSKLFPDTTRTDLWIESIFEEVDTDTQTDVGCRLSTRLSLQILYAANGTFSGPDFSIRGLKYKLYNSLFDNISCVDYECQFQDRKIQTLLQLTTSVDFIDVSQAPFVKQRAAPGTTNLLPDDFFFPFFVSAGAIVRTQTFLLVILLFTQCVMII